MKTRVPIVNILGLAVILIVASIGIGLSVLLAGGSKLLSVQSGSMVPALNKGDLIAVHKTPARDLRVGDVVTYTNRDNPHETITHRIASIAGDMQGRITTKGDANDVADKAVVPSQVIGRVEHRIPYAGYAVDFIKHPVGLVLIIYLPALFIIGYEIWHLAKYFKQTQPYRARLAPRDEMDDSLSFDLPASV